LSNLLLNTAAQNLPAAGSDNATDNAPSSNKVDPITKFAEDYYEKTLRGFELLSKIKHNHSIGDLGQQLSELRLARGKSTEVSSQKPLEKLLDTSKSKFQFNGWLANLYSIYAGINGRALDKAYSETGNLDDEQRVLKREAMGTVTSGVVNNLKRVWGASASLIYNAQRGM